MRAPARTHTHSQHENFPLHTDVYTWTKTVWSHPNPDGRMFFALQPPIPPPPPHPLYTHTHPKVLIRSKWSKDTDGPWQSHTHTHSPPVLSPTRPAWNQNPAPGLWPAYLDEKHFLRLCDLWPWGETHLTHTYTCKSRSSINNETKFICVPNSINIHSVCVFGGCLGYRAKDAWGGIATKARFTKQSCGGVFVLVECAFVCVCVVEKRGGGDLEGSRH